MSYQKTGILALFEHLDVFCDTIQKMKKRPDVDRYEIYSPTSYHELEEACEFTPSPVRFFTLIGAMTGTIAGFGLCLLCDWDWPLVVGGKTAGIYSLPAYVVIGFEMTILLGAIATIAGMLVMGKIPNPHAQILDSRLTDDRFGIFIPDEADGGSQAQFLRECGAEEIKVIRANASH